MAWTRDREDNQLFNFFSFYSLGGPDGALVESITGGDATETEFYKVAEVRLHLSVAFVSVEDFVIMLSTANQGSAYNQVFVSQAMLGITDFLWQPDQPLCFMSGDTLTFQLSLVSATNYVGLNVMGWAVAS